MTRSRKALYLVTKKLKESTTSKNFARLLMLTLSPGRGSKVTESGDERWFEDSPIWAEAAGETGSAESMLLPACTAGTPQSLSPSSAAKRTPASGEMTDGAAVSPEAANLGTEIHEVLSRIEWNPSTASLTSCSLEARSLLEKFLITPEAANLFTKPAGEWEVWREKAFDLMNDGRWISGVFDRVHIRRESGRAEEVLIFDYKTNRSTPVAIATEYAGQMEQYRLAASRLLDIPTDKVTARTVPIRA